MELRINGELQTFPDDELTLVELLDALDIPTVRGVAVAVNDTVITRSRWPESSVTNGDRVEIIRATQGG
jgi:sulfur carrier protein